MLDLFVLLLPFSTIRNSTMLNCQFREFFILYNNTIIIYSQKLLLIILLNLFHCYGNYTTCFPLNNSSMHILLQISQFSNHLFGVKYLAWHANLFYELPRCHKTFISILFMCTHDLAYQLVCKNVVFFYAGKYLANASVQ